jgi:hypothetical protein
LASFVRQFQAELSASLGAAFLPYDVAQVHGTVIGLEGRRRDGHIENLNFRECRQETRAMDPAVLLAFLRSPSVPTFDVQIGGFRREEDYGFLSRGKHPYSRAFSIQGPIAVMMGWPINGGNVLDGFRRSFNRLNVLHKWHRSDSSVDNDFFVVLGRVARDSVGDEDIADTEQRVRERLSTSDPLQITVSAASLQIVCYSDVQLPPASSHAHAILDPALTPEKLLQCYSDCMKE